MIPRSEKIGVDWFILIDFVGMITLKYLKDYNSIPKINVLLKISNQYIILYNISMNMMELLWY